MFVRLLNKPELKPVAEPGRFQALPATHQFIMSERMHERLNCDNCDSSQESAVRPVCKDQWIYKRRQRRQ